MGILARLFGRRYRDVADAGDLGVGDIALQGTAEAIEPLEGLFDSTERLLAIDYRAWPPSTTIGMDGSMSHGSRAFEVRAHQAVDFVLLVGPHRILVTVRHGQDVVGLHASLLARYGVGLRTEVTGIPDGARLAVEGRVRSSHTSGSPHRAEPYSAVLDAHRFWQL